MSSNKLLKNIPLVLPYSSQPWIVKLSSSILFFRADLQTFPKNLPFYNVFREHYHKVVKLTGQWLYFPLHISFERPTIKPLLLVNVLFRFIHINCINILLHWTGSLTNPILHQVEKNNLQIWYIFVMFPSILNLLF